MVKSKAKPIPKSTSSKSFEHVDGANRYAQDVISGRILACKWVILACERHVRDLVASETLSFQYRFDAEKAERACRFISRLPHTKGKWARKDPHTGRFETIKLEGWQQFILASIFGWVRKSTGTRRFIKARIYVPRKNGKSIFGAGIGLYMLGFDNEPGAEVYSGATSEKQAWEVFGPAKQMCLKSPNLCSAAGIEVKAESLYRGDDNSKFEPIIGKPGDGASPHCAITDEYHEHKTSVMLDTMETGMGARDQPLSAVISTAGSDISSPCREDWKMCESLLKSDGGFEDETCFAIIYTIDEGDDWESEEALIKANPNWGISINVEQMLAKLRTVKQRASQQSAYKTKHLNLWVNAKEGYFNTSEWAALGDEKIKREDYKDYPCYLAGDLASKHDLVALMQLFCLPDGRYAVFGKYYIPEATLDLTENQHYRTWRIGEHIEAAGENITDLDVFKEDVIELCGEYQVEEMPSDPNRAWGVLPQLAAEGVPVVEYRNTILTMSEPMKQLDALIRAGKIIHNGDPVLAWAIGNTTGKLDKKDNVYPNKESPANKIDPVVALIMAIGRAMTRGPAPAGPLIYF